MSQPKQPNCNMFTHEIPHLMEPGIVPKLTDDDTPILDLTPYLELLVRPLVFQDISGRAPKDDTPHGRALVAAVYRAVDELENQGERSNRIALQLLEALAHYEFALCEAV